MIRKSVPIEELWCDNPAKAPRLESMAVQVSVDLVCIKITEYDNPLQTGKVDGCGNERFCLQVRGGAWVVV